jgi:hypothetical protein
VEIRWPNGNKEVHSNISGDQLLTVREGTGIVPSLGWPKR